jgi:hypothetical protein
MKFIWSIEVSGVCNFRCRHCPYPNAKRKKGYMDIKTFRRTMELVRKLGQNLVCLHNFGEPLMHPEIVDFVRIARKSVDNVIFSTNGSLMTRDLAKSLKEAGLTRITLSAHDIKSFINAVLCCRGLGLLRLRDMSLLFYHDWAGTAKHKTVLSRLFRAFDLLPRKIRASQGCDFLRKEWISVLWDGRINSCCIDAEGLGVLGSVFDKDAIELKPKNFSLCKGCHVPTGYMESCNAGKGSPEDYFYKK